MSRNYSWAVQPSCNKADVTNYCVGEEEAKVKGAVRRRERESRSRIGGGGRAKIMRVLR